MLTRYQYVNAVKQNGGDEQLVEQAKFQYPGPRPQSLESAILMLADGCEARVRAERPMDEEHLRTSIKEVINNRVSSGQLDDTDLTLNDLEEILDSFTSTLKGIYHPRVKYPELDQPAPGKRALPGADEDTHPIAAIQTPDESADITISSPLDSSA